MQGVLLAVLFPLRWLAYELEEVGVPEPVPASVKLPRRSAAA